MAGGVGALGTSGFGVGGGSPLGATTTGTTATTGVQARAYSITPAFAAPPRNLVLRPRQDLQQVIASAARLPSRANIRALALGDVVILQGTVTTDRERRLTEAIVRLTPGVLTVRNELIVRPPGSGP